MAIKDFALYAYNLTSGVYRVIDEAWSIEELRFTTVAPGGYGDLSCKLKVPSARFLAQNSELALMANVALMDGPFPCFLGRWDEPAITLDANDGDLVDLTALGASACLSDDPQDSSYSQTAQNILINQMSSVTLKRNKTLPLDPDQSLLLPTNPAGTFNPAYNGKTFEEVLNELLGSLGDYTWGVWGHALHKDGASFPTWQLVAHARDTSTVAYTAYLTDMLSHDIRPSAEYAYNVVTVLYRDSGNSGVPTSVTITDSRLNSDGSQGTAPFPWRRFRKDLSNLLMTGAQATAIANAYLSDYQNGQAKVTVVVAQIRDANGQFLPLHQVRADTNIFLPDLGPLATQLPGGQVAYNWENGGNVFYIQETEYSETSGQTPQLTLTCNSYKDTAAFQVARLQQQLEKLTLKEKKVHNPVQATGEPERGTCGVGWPASALSTDTIEAGVNFKTIMSSTPSAVNLTSTSTSNAGTPTVTAITARGFQFQVKPAANGAGFWRGDYATQGN